MQYLVFNNGFGFYWLQTEDEPVFMNGTIEPVRGTFTYPTDPQSSYVWVFG